MIKDGWNIPNRIPFASELKVEDGAPITSKIISGAGTACIVDGLSVALVGSRLENGDEIIDSPNKAVAINIFKGDKAPQGFLVSEQEAKHG